MEVRLTDDTLRLGTSTHKIAIGNPSTMIGGGNPYRYQEITFPERTNERSMSGGLYTLEPGGQTNTVLITSPTHISTCLLEGNGWILITGPHQSGYYHLDSKKMDKHFVSYGQRSVVTYATGAKSEGAKFLEICKPAWTDGEMPIPFGSRMIEGYSIPIAYWDAIIRALSS